MFKDCLFVLAWRWASIRVLSGRELGRISCMLFWRGGRMYMLAVSEKEKGDEEAEQVSFGHLLYLSIGL